MKHTRPSSVAGKYPEDIWHVWHMPWVEEIRFWDRGANQAPRFRLGSKLYGLTQTGERHWILKLFELCALSWYLMKSCHMMMHYNHLTAGGDQRISLFQQRGLTGQHHHQTSLSIWTVWSITGHFVLGHYSAGVSFITDLRGKLLGTSPCLSAPEVKAHLLFWFIPTLAVPKMFSGISAEVCIHPGRHTMREPFCIHYKISRETFPYGIWNMHGLSNVSTP